MGGIMPDWKYTFSASFISEGTYSGVWENGRIRWYEDTPEKVQERIDKAKQLKEDKEKYPLFFIKEGIV